MGDEAETIEQKLIGAIEEATGTSYEDDGDQKLNSEQSDKAWRAVRQVINEHVTERGEWAGAPMPASNNRLVLEPRYPYPGLHGMKTDESDDGDIILRMEMKLANYKKAKKLGEEFPPDVDEHMQTLQTMMDLAEKKYKDLPVLVNTWRHSKMNDTWVEVWYDKKNNRRFHTLRYRTHRRALMVLDTLGVVQEVFSLETEMKAQEKLRGLLRPHTWAQYAMTSSFLESSSRSKVTYLFRRLRPTIAMTAHPKNGGMKVLACLCMHPIGYYDDTWTGALCPTDDVIAHLMMMRGDEHAFWKKSNQHSPLEPESGL